MSIPSSTADALYGLGHWLIQQQRLRDAIDVFRTMVMTAPHDERSWLGLGTSHERMGHDRVALELYRLGEVTVPTTFRCALARARLLKQIDADCDEAYERAEERARMQDHSLGDAIAHERSLA